MRNQERSSRSRHIHVWILILLSLWVPLMAFDQTTVLSVAPATPQEIGICQSVLKPLAEADTDEKRLAAITEMARRASLDGRRGPPHITPDSPFVKAVTREQPAFAVMHDALMKKDSKCQVWNLLSYRGAPSRLGGDEHGVVVINKDRPQLLIQFQGTNSHQVVLSRNSRGEWYPLTRVGNTLNQVTKTP